MQKIRIDFDNPGLPQHISAVENDSQSRFFQATLYENGKAYTAPEGATYSIMYRGFGPQNQGWYDTINDGAGKRAACAVSGNVVTCEIARQALQVPGHVSIVLCVTTGKGYMLKSWPIECDCKNDRYDSTAEIESFLYITQVSNADWTQAIQAWEDLKNTIDPTLSVSGKAADAAKVGEAINAEAERAKGVESQIKEDIVDKASGQIKGLLVKDSYVDKDGTVSDYVGWSRTNYIDVSQYSVLSLNVPMTIRYGVWLKEDKSTVVFPIVTTTKGEIELFVPLDAKYLVFSDSTTNMENVTISVKRRKSDELDFDGKRIDINYVNSGYIEYGKLQIADRWVATDYIEIPENLYITSDGTKDENDYNAFYDGNKTYIAPFNSKGEYIKIPDTAKYMRLSTLNSNEQRVYTRNPLPLKICSFNVGLWTDGKSSNARVDDANVESEAIKLRRFLGDENFDFLLCEEATHEFDKSYKINAYSYCFKNNLSYGWTTSDKSVSIQARQFLLTGKYKLKNVTYHNYENASTRGYVTFTSELADREITFINCHLSSGYSADDEMRAKERAELIQILKKCEYGVLMGDFNARSIDDFNDFSEFNVANHGYYGDFKTWPGAGVTDHGWPNGCIDNIITTKSIKIINVLMGEIDMSDHKPLIAAIEVL